MSADGCGCLADAEVLDRAGTRSAGADFGPVQLQSRGSGYENPQPSEEGRAAVRDALAQSLARCRPVPLSDEFRKVISVHPIAVRLGEGWRRPTEPRAATEN